MMAFNEYGRIEAASVAQPARDASRRRPNRRHWRALNFTAPPDIDAAVEQ